MDIRSWAYGHVEQGTRQPSPPLFPLLILVFSCLLLPNATSLRFDYNLSAAPGVLAGADLKYMADAAAAGDRINLTVASTWSTGRVAHGRPVQLWDDATGEVASFTSNFTFAITPLHSSSCTQGQQGDGIAFFVVPYPASMPQDARGGFLGLLDTTLTGFPPAVGVEVDTFRNVGWDPSGTANHVGVDVNDIRSAAYAALPDDAFDGGGAVSAWVRYDAGEGTLSASLRFDGRPGLGLYNVSAKVDLRRAGLPQNAAVGFSAATGDCVERHEILSWSFESTLATVAVVHNTGKWLPESLTYCLMTESKRKRIGLTAGLASVGTFVLVLIITLAAWLCHIRHLRRHREQVAESSESPLQADMDSELERETGPRRFTYSQLSQATHGFSDKEKLGEGGFGSVYRGFLQDQGLHVAIKRVSKTSRQGRREYLSEVTIISRLRHRNLVQLVGWCHDADELLLVYELVTNGSLDTHLYGARSIFLTWPIRYKIILGMGSALLYLHEEWEQCVVHRDIKSSNVMLDWSFDVKLGDFGLARLVDHGRGGYTTALAGTMGYMEPECAVTGRTGAKSDVYSFGVVVLEVVAGRKPILLQEEDEGKARLVQWVWELHGRGAIMEAADARLLHAGGELRVPEEMERALVVGLWCVHPDYASRPSIRQAMSVLHFEAPLPEIPPEMPLPTYRPLGAAGGDGTTSSSYTSSSASAATASTSGPSSATTRGSPAQTMDDRPVHTQYNPLSDARA
ncbi:hypothetical protein ACP4OV_014472 [Aristida adscensionis]